MSNNKKNHVNVAEGVIEFGGASYSLAGTSRDTYTRLALAGLQFILQRSKDKQKTYDKITSGAYWNKPPKHPLVVQAIANITIEQPEVVMERWTKLSKAAKAKYQQDPQVRAMIAELKLKLADDNSLVDFSEFGVNAKVRGGKLE